MGFDLYLLKRQCAIGAAKAEIVFQRDFKLHITRGVGAVIQIALGVLIEDIDGGRNFLLVQRHDGKDRFQAACAAEQMPGRALGRIDHDFFGVLAQRGFDGMGLVDIAQGRRSAVGIDEANIAHIQASVG